jgi:hypothetical protein
MNLQRQATWTGREGIGEQPAGAAALNSHAPPSAAAKDYLIQNQQ